MYLRNLLILPFLIVQVVVAAQSTDTLFLQAAAQKLQHAREYTLKVATLMPEENYGFKPSAEEMDFGQQLLHLASNLGWLSSAYLSKGSNPVSKEDSKLKGKKEIIAVLDKAYDYALQAMQQVAPKDLAEKVKFFAGPMNTLQIINLLNDHQTHHRAQMLVYLRLKGIQPPDYVGW